MPSSDDGLALLQFRLEEGLPSKAEAVGHGVLDGQSLTDIMGLPWSFWTSDARPACPPTAPCTAFRGRGWPNQQLATSVPCQPVRQMLYRTDRLPVSTSPGRPSGGPAGVPTLGIGTLHRSVVQSQDGAPFSATVRAGN